MIPTLRDYENELIITCEKACDDLVGLYLAKSCDEYISESHVPGKMIISTLTDKYIDKCIDIVTRSKENFNAITKTIDVEQMTTFFTNIRSGLPDVPLTISLCQLDEVGIIRPEYLNEYMEMCEKHIANISAGVSNSTYKKSEDAEYVNKIKRQLAKTDLKMDESSISNPDLQDLSDNLLITDIIPFLKQFPSIVKNLNIEIDNVVNQISATGERIKLIIKVIDEAPVSLEIRKKLNKALPLIIRNYFNIISHLSFVAIRKMSLVTYNTASIYNLYNRLLAFFPEGDRILHENTLDGLLDDIEDHELLGSMKDNAFSLIIPAVNRIIDRSKMGDMSTNDPTVMNIFNMVNVTDYQKEYDQRDYEAMCVPFKSIADSLTIFKDSILSGDIFDDAVTKSGLDNSFANKFANVANQLADIDEYTSNNPIGDEQHTIMRVFFDLEDFVENCKRISSAIGKTSDVFGDIVDALRDASDVIEDETEISKNTCIEALNFIEQLRGDFNNLIVIFSKALIARLGALGDMLENASCIKSIPDCVIESVTEIRDYLEFAVDSIRSDEKYTNEEIFAEMTRKFESAVTYKNSGMIVAYEAADAKSLIDNMNEFIKQLLLKWKLKITKLSAQYSPWLAQNKQALLSLDVNRIGGVTMAPYFALPDNIMINRVNANMKLVMSKVNTYTPEQMYTKNADVIRKELFSFIPGDESNLAIATKNMYMFGTVKQPEQVKYMGAKLKANVATMVDFCEKYVSASEQLEQQITHFSQTITNKCKTLEAKNSVKPVQKNPTIKEESTFMDTFGALFIEAVDGPKVTPPTAAPQTVAGAQVKTAQPQSPKTTSAVDSSIAIRAIKTDCKIFAAAVLTAYESRYTYYMSTLKAVVANTKATTTTNS